MAIFYTAASLSGAFSGLLAYAIGQMEGISGLGGWQWIFMYAFCCNSYLSDISANHNKNFSLEGLVPVVLSFFVWKLLPDSPETASFLTKREKEFIINRLALETGSGRGRVTNEDKIKPRHILDALKEWKIWCAWVMFWANTIGVYGCVYCNRHTSSAVVANLARKGSPRQCLL